MQQFKKGADAIVLSCFQTRLADRCCEVEEEGSHDAHGARSSARRQEPDIDGLFCDSNSAIGKSKSLPSSCISHLSLGTFRSLDKGNKINDNKTISYRNYSP